jgi:hypothetical protein
MMSNKKRLRQWKSGTHTDGNDMRWQLKDMEYDHVAATINSFPMLNTTPLRKELRRRSRRPIKMVISLLDTEKRLKPRNDKHRKSQRRAERAIKALERYLKTKP